MINKLLPDFAIPLGSSPGAGQGAGADPLVEAAEHLPLDERQTRRSEGLQTRAESASMTDWY